jgi:hypothetical protein
MGTLLHSRIKEVQFGMVPHGITTPKKFKTQPPDAKIMASAFWNSDRDIMSLFCHLMQQLMISITASCFSTMRTHKFARKHLGNCQRESSCCKTTYAHIWQIWQQTVVIITCLGHWRCTYLWEPKFKTDDKLKRSVLNCLCSHPSFFFAAAISALSRPWWKMCQC